MSMLARVIAAVLALTLLIGVTVPAAHAGGATVNVALGLASFAVFSQLVGPWWWYPRPVYAWYGPPVYYAPPAYYPAPVYYYSQPPQVVVQPAPAPAPAPTVVQYPHGRYELRGDGVTTAYQWVWIPNTPPPPAAPPPAAPPR